ncbi:hypothetical protein F2Q68_00045334 [Brassica cretica]|uniref:GRF-type domain-containing protein n=1 Tax=Brassica cretica TaxID=69181 RepID=A0A8S9LUE5_BRACR|nr:hypothetical protein F2Q68_00045334 [Brassica cretica]
MAGETSGGESSTTAMEQSNKNHAREVLCDCGKVAIIRQEWTDANPCRRFYRCSAGWRSVCDYFTWRDVEKPRGGKRPLCLKHEI